LFDPPVGLTVASRIKAPTTEKRTVSGRLPNTDYLASDAGSVLMHSHDGCIDHLHRNIMDCSQCIHDLVPDASPSPANEAIVTSRIGPNVSGRSRHGAPDLKTQKMPLSTRRSFTRGTPRGLFGRNGLMAVHS